MRQIRHLLCKVCGLLFAELAVAPATEDHGRCPRCGAHEIENVGGRRFV
jgi:predicted Zn-ribbon and HTH transcriptional regulator